MTDDPIAIVVAKGGDVAEVEAEVEAVDAPVAAPAEGSETAAGEAAAADEAPAPEAAADEAPAPEAAADDTPDDEAAETRDRPASSIGALPAAGSAATGPRTAGRFIADALHAAGVRVAFTVPGESFLGLLDALPEVGIRVVATRHEGGAAFMAEAYGQLTGRPAACLATRAVGAANLTIGIHTARADSTPLFAVVGQVPRAFRGREAFQEIDVAGSIGRVAAYAVEVDDPARLPAAMAEATRHALGGRPGPVVIAAPEDLLDELVPASADVIHVTRSRPADPDPDDVRAVIRRLAAAERPLILAGAGVLRSRSTADLVRFAEILEIPVVASWRRGDVFPNDHPLYLGMTGYAAPSTVLDRVAAADELLVIGCRLNEITSRGYRIPGPDQHWTHVDLEPRQARAGLTAPTFAMPADARTFLRMASRLLAGAVHDRDRLDARRAMNAADRAAWEASAVVDGGVWSGPGVHPGRIVASLAATLPPEATITVDAGNASGWVARGYRWRRPGTLLGPTSGAMGYALPAAIAASIVHRDRPVVGITGDGAFAMTMAELETAVREECRFVLCVFDNRRYGTIRMHQDERGTGQGIGTELGPLDIAALAEGFGARGVRVDDDRDFAAVLAEALAHDGPTVVHLPLDPAWVSVDRPATA